METTHPLDCAYCELENATSVPTWRLLMEQWLKDPSKAREIYVHTMYWLWERLMPWHSSSPHEAWRKGYVEGLKEPRRCSACRQ